MMSYTCDLWDCDADFRLVQVLLKMEGLVDEKEKAVLGSVTGSPAAGETLSKK